MFVKNISIAMSFNHLTNSVASQHSHQSKMWVTPHLLALVLFFDFQLFSSKIPAVDPLGSIFYRFFAFYRPYRLCPIHCCFTSRGIFNINFRAINVQGDTEDFQQWREEMCVISGGSNGGHVLHALRESGRVVVCRSIDRWDRDDLL